MLIDDVIKLEKYRKVQQKNPDVSERIKRKIKKLEDKHVAVRLDRDGVRDLYVDKYQNKVATFQNGEIKQVGGKHFHPNFMPFIYAIMVIIVLSITFPLIVGAFPFLAQWEDAVKFIIKPLVIIAILLLFYFHQHFFKERKHLIVMHVGILFINVLGLASYFF